MYEEDDVEIALRFSRIIPFPNISSRIVGTLHPASYVYLPCNRPRPYLTVCERTRSNILPSVRSDQARVRVSRIVRFSLLASI